VEWQKSLVQAGRVRHRNRLPVPAAGRWRRAPGGARPRAWGPLASPLQKQRRGIIMLANLAWRGWAAVRRGGVGEPGPAPPRPGESGRPQSQRRSGLPGNGRAPSFDAAAASFICISGVLPEKARLDCWRYQSKPLPTIARPFLRCTL
jgi:hypothetical protein